jgi:hypothetical protein
VSGSGGGKTGLSRRSGKEIFVIIFIALLFDCDKTWAALGCKAAENELTRWLETKLKHQIEL